MNKTINNLKLRKGQSGFTIIEVMIVLAIAGLILLIVFLAVPALQRNSRNTTAKNDAASVAAAMNEYKSNNDGGSPTGGTIASGVFTTTGSGTNATGKVSGSATIVTVAPASPGQIQLGINKKCNGNAFDINPANNQLAILYWTEGATGTTKCLDV
jgi:prepilin-type N-terminal cleavage/methylation domain-containing protein